MGTASLSFQTGTNPALTYAVTVADADMARIAAAMQARYFPQGVLVTPSSISTTGVVSPAVYAVPTAAQIMQAAAQDIVNRMLADTVAHEQRLAQEAAAAAITPIAATP